MAVATEREYLLFINGESSEPSGGELKELSEPATGEPLAKVAMANEADVDRAVDAARAALDGDWGRTPPTERSRLLHALADALVANRKESRPSSTRRSRTSVSTPRRSPRSAAARTRWAARSSSTR
jgi:acyl-CoA reductase-like NAD-dependent aldehyde dehydrogenase